MTFILFGVFALLVVCNVPIAASLFSAALDGYEYIFMLEILPCLVLIIQLSPDMPGSSINGRNH